MREIILAPNREENAHLARTRLAEELDNQPKRPSAWQRYRPRWNTRDKLTFWLPLGVVCVAAVCAAYWTEISTATASKVEEIREAVVDHPEFAVKRVEVTGRRETSRDFVMDALGVDPARTQISSLNFDVAAARDRLVSSPWIEDASVALDPTGTLRLRLSERTPAAIWRASGTYWLIDAEGELIATVDGPGDRLDLPYLLGAGANEAIEDANRLLASTPTHVLDEILALVRRGGRRWDVVSKHGFVVKLPEDRALDALRAYGRSNLGERLKPLAVLSLDLRRPSEPPVLALEGGTNDLRLEALAELRKPDPKRR